jgi:flavin-dependent dehydrogenase
VAGALTLQAGSKIAVIGGGPAGSFFTHLALKHAEKRGPAVSIAIFDGKDFLQRGPRGCNLCAGVISGALEAKLREEGLFLPEQRIVNRISGYSLHIEKETLRLPCAENGSRPIATVFRGNGPRYSQFPHIISFDDYLLHCAADRGAQVISQPVWKIQLPSSRGGPVALHFGERLSPQRYEADLVVGAFGLNTHLLKLVQNLGFGYKPPSTLMTFQAEFRLGAEKTEKHFQHDIHVYLPRSKSIRYATVIPKGDYVTVTIVGKKAATPNLIREFLGLEEIKGVFPPSRPHCSCFPKIAVSAARNPFSDRLVLIGDASFARHYKNGIESAFLTAKLAAEAVFNHALDRETLSHAFYGPAKRLIVRDNLYGRVLIRLNDLLTSAPLLSQAHFSLAKREGRSVAPKKLRRILWSMFTGDIPYRDIFGLALDVRLQSALFLNTIKLLIQKMKIYLVSSP